MSSDDSNFDKEAEREKLREKYEQDEKDRENTRRMSELLLQGATMTGKHCNRCGDPIFRYDGQEFCPTCQREVEGDAGGRGAGQGDAGQEDAGQQAADQRSTAADPAADRGSEGQPPAEATTTETPETAGGTDPEQTEQPDDEPRVEIDGVRVTGHHADHSDRRRPPSQQSKTAREENARLRSRDHRPENAGDLATAREALVRKLTDLARRAEETDDVARARELLEATREAAEALAALDRANR